MLGRRLAALVMIYSEALRTEQEGEVHATLEFVRYGLATGDERVLVADANPGALFPMDGHTLGYLPWGDATR